MKERIAFLCVKITPVLYGRDYGNTRELEIVVKTDSKEYKTVEFFELDDFLSLKDLLFEKSKLIIDKLVKEGQAHV